MTRSGHAESPVQMSVFSLQIETTRRGIFHPVPYVYFLGPALLEVDLLKLALQDSEECCLPATVTVLVSTSQPLLTLVKSAQTSQSAVA